MIDRASCGADRCAAFVCADCAAFDRKLSRLRNVCIDTTHQACEYISCVPSPRQVLDILTEACATNLWLCKVCFVSRWTDSEMHVKERTFSREGKELEEKLCPRVAGARRLL